MDIWTKLLEGETKSRLLTSVERRAYVQCGDLRSPDSAHRRVVMSGLI
jgi:hypothetical protein